MNHLQNSTNFIHTQFTDIFTTMFFFTDGQVEVDKSRSFAATVTAALPVGRFYYL